MSMVDQKFDLKKIMEKDIAQLTPEELRLRLKALEEKITVLTRETMVKSPTDLTAIGPDDLVEISMCSGPMGDVFKIQEKPYGPGRHTVTKRIADQLAYMVSEAFKIERERLMSRSNVMEGALLRGEQLAKIERYEEIMKEN